MKIAIVGSGIAGLTAAWLLHRKHDVYVFEKNDYIGGHTHTVPVQENDKTLAIDTGFIVFNQKNYPGLCRLFNLLGVESQDSDMSFSVYCEKTKLEYNGTNLNRLFSQRRNILNPTFLGMLKDILRFNRQGQRALKNTLDDRITVAEFIKQQHYSDAFFRYYLIPLGASLWSCPAPVFRAFPIKFVLEFLANHGMLQTGQRPSWKTVTGGSHRYVERMKAGFAKKIYLNHAVHGVLRKHREIALIFSGGKTDIFDEVILATHADTSLALLQNASEEEQRLLSHFSYQDNEVILHTDVSMLPQKTRTWGSWNYRIPATDKAQVSVAYNMNRLQNINSRKTYIVSLNQTDSIASDKIIRRLRYQHPVFKPGRDAIQKQHDTLIRHQGISCCGAYWGYGFHEDGVRSALAVGASFGAGLPT